MINWKTTVSGLIGAVGAYLSSLDNPTLKIAGQVLTAVGMALLGYVSKDHDKK